MYQSSCFQSNRTCNCARAISNSSSFPSWFIHFITTTPFESPQGTMFPLHSYQSNLPLFLRNVCRFEYAIYRTQGFSQIYHPYDGAPKHLSHISSQFNVKQIQSVESTLSLVSRRSDGSIETNWNHCHQQKLRPVMSRKLTFTLCMIPVRAIIHRS